MKVKTVELDQFKNFSKVSVNFDPNITYLVGKNGAGKSTLGTDAIWFILKGIGEKGDVLKGQRKLFIKEGTSTTGTMVLTDGINDWTVTRTVTEKGQKLEIKAPDGSSLGQDFIDSFWSDALINPMAFAEMTPKQQAQALGIDTSSFDEELSELKAERTLIGREIKAFGDIPIPEKLEKVDVSDLLKEKEDILKKNSEIQQVERTKSELSGRVESLDAQIVAMKAKIAAMEESKLSLLKDIASLPPVQEILSYDYIDEKIRTAAVHNAMAIDYENAMTKLAAKEEKKEELGKNLQAQAEVEARKIEYIRSRQLPFGNIAVDEDGGLVLKGRPIKKPHFSTGELLRIVPLLMASKNPEFKYVFIQDWMLMDEEKQGQVVEYLLGQGFQIVIEVVGDKPVGENSIILQDL